MFQAETELSQVKLLNNTSANILPINIDKALLYQIIVSIISYLLVNIPDEGTIEIKASLLEHQKFGKNLSIKIQDDGYGELHELEKTNNYYKIFLLKWDEIKQIINNIGGQAHLESDRYQGSRISLLFDINNNIKEQPVINCKQEKVTNVIELFDKLY
jgi:hypothetical protein